MDSRSLLVDGQISLNSWLYIYWVVCFFYVVHGNFNNLFSYWNSLWQLTRSLQVNFFYWQRYLFLAFLYNVAEKDVTYKI